MNKDQIISFLELGRLDYVLDNCLKSRDINISKITLEYNSLRKKMIQNLISEQKYSDEKNKLIIDLISILRGDLSKPEVEIFVIIALKEEFQEFQNLVDCEGDFDMDINLYVFNFKTRNGIVGKAIYLGEMGVTNSAVYTQRILTKYSVKKIVNIGIAGSLESYVKCGDVIIGSQIDGYAENGRLFDDKEGVSLSFSGEVYRTTPRFLKIADAISIVNATKFDDFNYNAKEILIENIGEDKYVELIDNGLINTLFQIRTGKIASGNFVNTSSNFTKLLKDARDRHFLAIEMEAFGMLRANDITSSEIVIIRGISDMSNSDKEITDRIGGRVLRKIAMQNAIMVFEMIMELDSFQCDKY